MAELLKSGSAASVQENVRKKLEVADGITGPWIILDNQINRLAVDLIVNGGSGFFETTNDGAGASLNPPTAVGIQWPQGVVTANTTAWTVGVFAIRLVSVSGPITGFLNGVYN